MSLSQMMMQDAGMMYRAAEGLFRRVDDLDWKPATGDNWMTTGQLLRHCAEACGATMKGFVTGDWSILEDHQPEDGAEEAALPKAEEMPTVESVDEALQLLLKDKALCMTFLGKMDDEHLLNERSVAPWGGPERALFQHCQECIWHLGQHKGQLFYYLKLQGQPVNTMHLWMGDE